MVQYSGVGVVDIFPKRKKSVSVLFVCMGNICRSPTAQGVFQQLVNESDLPMNFIVDSAGTHAYHRGEAPDRRSQVALERYKIDISRQRARPIVNDDFDKFDYILAMDKSNLLALKKQQRTANGKAKVALLMDYGPPGSPVEVPDPYYGGHEGFSEVIQLAQSACLGLLDHIAQKNS